jgi:hypothetical protein
MRLADNLWRDGSVHPMSELAVAAVDYYRMTLDPKGDIMLMGKPDYDVELERAARTICELTDTKYMGVSHETL